MQQQTKQIKLFLFFLEFILFFFYLGGQWETKDSSSFNRPKFNDLKQAPNYFILI